MSDHRDPDAGKWEALDALDKIDWMIESTGWALEAVPARPDVVPPNPAYAYSIGLPAAVDFPEVAVFGLTPVAAKGEGPPFAPPGGARLEIVTSRRAVRGDRLDGAI